MRRLCLSVLAMAVLLAGPAAVRPEERGGRHAPEPAPRATEAQPAVAPAPAHGAGSASPGAAAHGGAPAAGGHGAPAAGHGAPAAGHGSSYWSLFAIHALGFVLLLAVLARYAWPGIRKGLDGRREEVAGAFRKAEADEREVQRLLTEYQDKLRAFPLEAKRRRDEALRQGRILRLQVEEEARLQARQMMEKARREVDLMRARTAAEVRRQLIDRAFADAAGLLAGQVDDRLQASLVDAVIADLERRPAQG
jgi:F-type H+-transporting ATPase subunit b